MNHEEFISASARKIGFDLVGFTEFTLLENEVEKLQKWLENNYHAGMSYMEKNIEKRKDIRLILQDAKSVISVGLNYFVDNKFGMKNRYGKVSRYAWGEDYHFVLWRMLDELIERIKEVIPEFNGKAYVDTGPVMDKVWAVKSGLGWMGKNSNVINKEKGSYFFIGNIISNLELKNSQTIGNFCGTCNACIEACPTSAIVEDYVVDANKCISYLTIENKEEIPDEFKNKFNNWIFGCDICQEVCPWNIKFSSTTSTIYFKENIKRELSFDHIENMTADEFNSFFAESPIKRAKLSGLKRNKKFLEK